MSTPRRVRGATTSQTRTGSDFPLACTGSASRYSITVDVARYVVSSTRIPSTGAADWRRERGVDDVARRHALALLRPGGERDHRLAGRHADPHVQAEGRVGRVQLAQGVSGGYRRAHAALGVVLVRQRGAEERHDGVADELLHGAAVALELGLHAGVVRREHSADVLGVELLGAAGEPDQVGEQHGDDLALLEDGRLGLAGLEGGAAGGAEGEAERRPPRRSSRTRARAEARSCRRTALPGGSRSYKTHIRP